ncbi:MAG: hypothetical protein JNM27_10465 [Leptospirales bacterium]|nr:hypothetical protein [Leptospirales bacterium]
MSVKHTSRQIVLCAIILLTLLTLHSLQAQPDARSNVQTGPHESWSDLDSQESRVYGSEKERKYPINAFIVEKEEWEDHYSFHFLWLYRNTDYPKYRSRALLPFYYHLESKIDNRERSVYFPFYLGQKDADTTFHLTPLTLFDDSESSGWFHLYGWLFLRRGDSRASHTALLPLFFTGSGTDEFYASVLPLFYYERSASDSYKSRSLITPVLYASGSDSSDRSESFSISPLHIHNFSSYKETGSTINDGYIGFPFIPLAYYSSWNGDTSHHKILTLIDWKSNSNGLSRFYVFPLIFYGSDYLVAAPIYFRFGDPGSESITRFVPGIFYWDKEGKDQHVNILGLVDLGYGEKGLERTWVLPFVFREAEYFHLAPFYFSSWSTNDKQETTETYRMGPVYYWHTSETDQIRERLIGPVWWSSNGNRSSSFHIFPFSFYWKSPARDEDLGRSSFAANPLFVHSQEYAGMNDQLEFSDLFWAPILPLYYSHQTEIKSRRHLLLANWSTDVSGISQFWFIPFYFWRQGKAMGYLYIPPFYIRPSGPNVDEGFSLGLIHYHSWSPEHDKLWLLLYYKDIQASEQYMHVVPFYYSWHTQETTGQLAFPLWLEYEDKQKAWSINLAGISKSRAAGVVGSRVGTKEGRWYLDTEVSWLYNAFSASARVSMPGKSTKPETEVTLADLKDTGIRDIAEQEQKKPSLAGVPRLTRKLNVSRDETFYYWGFSVLYGVLSYQHADSNRHFRLLPFAWLSWDTQSDDKVTVIPGAYLDYHSEDTDYFALFPAFIPIYGKQRVGKSYIEAYGVFLGINEYDDQTKRKELSVLWPLANFYSSPEEEGSRVIPVYWNRLTRRDGIVEKTTFSLLHFRGSTESKSANDSFWVAPLFLPIFLKSNNETQTQKGMWTALLPFFYFSSDETPADGRSELTFASLPGIYYNRDKKEDGGKVTGRSTLFVLGYYSSGNLEDSSLSVLFGLYKSHSSSDEEYRQLLWGLYASDSTSESARRWLIPFYYQRNNKTNPNDGTFYLFPYYSSTSGDETSMHLVPFVFSWRDTTSWSAFITGLYLTSSPTYSRQNFMYLLDHVRSNDTHHYRALLGAVHLESAPQYSESDLLYGSLVNVRSNPADSEFDLDYLLYLGSVERNKTYLHHRLLPAYWYESEPGLTFLVTPLGYYKNDTNNNIFRTMLPIVPVVWYHSDVGQDTFQLGLLGTAWYRNFESAERSDRFMLLGGILYNEVQRPERGYRSRGSLWGLIWDYETESNGFSKFSILKFVYSRTSDEDGVRTRILGISI